MASIYTTCVLSCLVALACCRDVFAAQCYRSVSLAEYPNCQLLAETYALHWAVKATTISYAVEVDGAPGWLGLGISDGGGMTGADMVVVQTLDNGVTWVVGDYFSEEEGTPRQDENLGGRQDVTLLRKVVQNPLWTFAVFSRPLESCDRWDWPVLHDVDQTLIWAYGPGHLSYHDLSRGSATVRLQPLQGAPAMPAEPPDLQEFKMAFPKPYTIPTAATTYMCVNVEFPTDAKYHIVRYNANVQSPLVHHLLVYSCSSLPVHPVGEIFECTDHAEEACSAAYLLSAHGEINVNMPPEAALPIGAGSVQYGMLQIHYTNLPGRPGLVDQSGFTAYITKQLRPYDMGILTLGTTNLTLPPGLSAVVAEPNACPATCTSQLTQPLNVVGSFLHMHFKGKSISTRLIRDGQELPAIAFNNYYAYNSQSMKGAPVGARTIQPGDTLYTTCTYDTTSVTDVTRFGLASTSEMCFNFLMYWPKMDNIDTCTTLDFKQLAEGPLAICANSAEFNRSVPLATDMERKQVVVSHLDDRMYRPYVSACGLSSLRQPVLAVPAAPPPPIVRPGTPAGSAASLPPPPTTDAPASGNTGAAVGAVVGVTLALSLLGAVLWQRYGRPEEQRYALVEAEQAQVPPQQV